MYICIHFIVKLYNKLWLPGKIHSHCVCIVLPILRSIDSYKLTPVTLMSQVTLCGCTSVTESNIKFVRVLGLHGSSSGL
jgi:hypothetical protein